MKSKIAVVIRESAEKVIDHFFENERKHFEEYFNVEIKEGDSLVSWMESCYETPMINHIFYHLMVLKLSIADEKELFF